MKDAEPSQAILDLWMWLVVKQGPNIPGQYAQNTELKIWNQPTIGSDQTEM